MADESLEITKGSATVLLIECSKYVIDETYNSYMKLDENLLRFAIASTHGKGMGVSIRLEHVTTMIKTDGKLRIFSPDIHIIYATPDEYKKLERATRRRSDRKRDASPKRK